MDRLRCYDANNATVIAHSSRVVSRGFKSRSEGYQFGPNVIFLSLFVCVSLFRMKSLSL